MEEWYKRTFLWGQTNLTEDDPAKCNLDFWIDYWKKTGIEGIIINCGGIVNYYQSRFRTQYRAEYLGDKDYFGIWNDAARKAGLAVVARMDINATSGEAFEEHPDWYCRNKEGGPILSQGRYVSCVNGGYYQEFLPEVFKEIIDRYHPDGFADNSWAGLKRDTICYCDTCQMKFREECGLELPERPDWTDPVYRKWVRWNYEIRVRNWGFFNDITRKEGGEDCRWFGMLTADPFDTGGRFYDVKKLAERSDFIFSDHQSRDDTFGFEQNALNANLLKSASGKDVIVAESMAHYYKGIRTFRLCAAPRQEVRNWMLSGIAGGIAPWYHFVGGGTEDKRKFHISDDIFVWLKSHKSCFENRRNIAGVGLLWNQESAVYYGRDDGRTISGYPFFGFARALSKAGIPFVPVHTDDLDRYADRLQAIVLPNVAILTDRQEEAILRFLDAGKGMVLTGRTGLMDEEGEELPDGASKVLRRIGIRKTGRTTGAGKDSQADWMHHEAHNYMRKENDSPLFRGLEETDIIPFGGEVFETKSEGVLKPAMHLIPAFPIYPPEFAWIREERQEMSLAYTGVLESGSRVVYMPADIDRCYIHYCLPDLGLLLRNAVSYAAQDRFAVRVEGPGHVHCESYVQESRLILHLVNLSGSDGPVGTVTESFPVGPVEIRVEGDLAGQAAVSVVSGERLPVTQDGNNVLIRLELLKEQEVLVLEGYVYPYHSRRSDNKIE